MLSTIPLDAYHLCLTSAGNGPITIQLSLSLAFGNHFITLPNLPHPRIEPPIRSLRYRSFRVRYDTSATHQIDAPWGDRAVYSRHSWQGREEILSDHIFVSPVGCDHVLGSEGGVFCTNASLTCTDHWLRFSATDTNLHSGVSRGASKRLSR